MMYPYPSGYSTIQRKNEAAIPATLVVSFFFRLSFVAGTKNVQSLTSLFVDILYMVGTK